MMLSLMCMNGGIPCAYIFSVGYLFRSFVRLVFGDTTCR